jgi:BASS family bile acid:Na+ symporter
MLLQKFADLSVLVFVTSSMLAMGMSQPLAHVIAPLRKPLPVLLALCANFIVAPLLTIALSRVVPLEPAHAIGLLLLGGAAGAPFLPKLAELSGGNLAYSVALMMLLVVGTIIFMPLAMPLIVPGLTANPWTIAKPLLLMMLVPLVLGFVLARSGNPWKDRLLIFVRTLSNLAFVLLVVLLVGVNLKTLASTFGSFAIGTYALFVLMMVGLSFLLGAADRATRPVFALGAGNRNIAAALVVAGASYDDPAITVMLLVASVVGLVVLLLLATALRQTSGARSVT